MRRARSALIGLLLMAGWSTAQTSAGQASAAQTSVAQSAAASPGSVPLSTPPGATTDPARAAAPGPVNALISALKRSWQAEARGEAVLELVFPPSSTPLRRARALPRLAAVPALIRRNFVVTVGAAAETVAGRPALIYTLTPRNAQAARWTLWIDRKWKVPLAYQERTPDGSLARRAELTSVSPTLTRLAVATPAAPLTGAPALKKALLSALPGLKLPAGFEPLSVQRRTGTAGPTSTEVLLTDGLNVLALVVSPRPVQAASGVAVRRLKGQSVWLVGNLPQNALEDALGSVRGLDAQAIGNLPGTSGPPAASDQ
ncbi:transcriptional regulator [Deinococcus altitudinis]|uniref:transcriptional regulator n=1 Tax=Deinococcus altitudinis TaxID=468914 RepID=UPI003891673E